MREIWKKRKSDNYFKQKPVKTALQVQVSAGATLSMAWEAGRRVFWNSWVVVGYGTGPGGSILLPKWLVCTLEFAKLKKTDSRTVWLGSLRSKWTKQEAGGVSVRDFWLFTVSFQQIIMYDFFQKCPQRFFFVHLSIKMKHKNGLDYDLEVY